MGKRGCRVEVEEQGGEMGQPGRAREAGGRELLKEQRKKIKRK